MVSDTEIYNCTYRELVLWIKELLDMRRQDLSVYDRNIRQAGRIMELEFDLRKYHAMIVEDQEDSVVKEYGVMQSDVVSNEELMKARAKRKAGGGNPPTEEWLTQLDWGTEFLVRPKQQKTWLLVKFMMAGVKNGCALVIPVQGDEPVQDDKQWMWVDPIEFCKYWELMTIILVPEKDDE